MEGSARPAKERKGPRPVFTFGTEAVMNPQVDTRQAGVVLMAVLPFLTLLGLVGVAFVTYSN